MIFDEWFEQVNKRDAKLQKEQSHRVPNARRQEKLRFQDPKVDDERASMNLVNECNQITMAFA